MINLAKKQQRSNQNDSQILLAASMDGPSVYWTVNDLFKFNNKAFMAYHVAFSGYDYLTPLGCMLGAIGLPYTPKFSNLTRLQAAGTGGLIGGGTGMACGLMMMRMVANAKETREGTPPWNEEGIQMRVDGISTNFHVRAVDLGVWIGALAGLAYGPAKLGLSSGTFGKLQALTLGSAAGTIASLALVIATK